MTPSRCGDSAADVVDRLRAAACGSCEAALLIEAADEIARLRGEREGAHIDWERHRVVVDGSPLRLTAVEWTLLAVLAKRAGHLVLRDQLLDALYWNDSAGGAKPKILDVFICHLRAKLPWPITTVHRQGYILEGYRYRREAPPPHAVAGVSLARLMARR